MLPQRLDRTLIYESEWINVYTDRVQLPSGRIIEQYHQLDYPKESVVIVVTDSEGRICITKNLRYSIQKITWELPAGWQDKGESIETTAAREAQEETGCTVNNVTHVYSFNPSNGMSNQLVHIAYATVTNEAVTPMDTDEVASVFWLSPQEIRALIKKKEISDGISLIALLYFFNDVD